MADRTGTRGASLGRETENVLGSGSTLQGATSLATVGVAWRNLGRNRKRTLLTASAVGFASMLLVFAMSMQGGSYGAMIDNATRLVTGHLQIQDARFFDDPKMRYLIRDADARVKALEADPRVRAASPRISAFAVLSGAEQSFGGQVMGVDPLRERAFSLLPEFVDEGVWLSGKAGEIVLGKALARNLDVRLGDEVVMLGTAPDGSVAAAVATLVGILDTGQPEIDRSLAQMNIADVREAFLLENAAHAIVLTVDDVREADALAPLLLSAVTDGTDLRPFPAGADSRTRADDRTRQGLCVFLLPPARAHGDVLDHQHFHDDRVRTNPRIRDAARHRLPARIHHCAAADRVAAPLRPWRAWRHARRPRPDRQSDDRRYPARRHGRGAAGSTTCPNAFSRL